MKSPVVLALWLEVLCVGSAIAKQGFDCNNATSCKSQCASSSSTSRIFHFYVGETLSWNCTLGENCTNATTADINFCFNGNVPDHLTHIVDSRTKELRIPNVTEDHKGSYFCYVSGCYADGIEMQIAYPAEPPDVEVLYEYLSDTAERLIIEATPKARNRNVNWTWDIRYKLNRRRSEDLYKSLTTSCPAGNKNWTCDTSQVFPCSCPENDSGRECKLQNEGQDLCFITDMSHTIRVKMSSESFGSAQTNVTVQPSYKIARAPEVYRLHSNVSSRQAEVRWEMWPGLQDMVYSVSYRPVGNAPWQEHNETKSPVTITGLVPNTAYKVRVSAKFQVSTLWSKPVEAEFNTSEDVPSESPKLSVGSYIYVSAPDCPGNGQDSLFLYTKPIPVESQNGKLLNYKLNVNPPLANETNPLTRPVTNQTIVLCGVRQDKDSVVELRASTKMGVSVVPSRIIIPSNAPKKPVQVFAEKLSVATVHVEWTNLLNTSQPHNVTIHLCRQIDRHLKCLDGYDWLTVTGPVSSHNVTNASLGFQSDLRVGVSVEVGGVSSGIAWSSCLYDRHSVPGKVAYFDVKLFEVEWSPPDCSRLTSLPFSYEVRYGDVSSEKFSTQCDKDSAVLQPQSLHVCSPNSEYGTLCETSLESLHPGHKYFVCVRGISHGHKDNSGKWSYLETYIPDTPNEGLIVGLCIGGMLLIALVIFLCRRCYVKQKEGKFKFEYPSEVEQSPYYGESNGYTYQTVSTDITGMSCGGTSKSNGHIPSSVDHPATNGDFIRLSDECPAPDSPGPQSPVPGSPVVRFPGPQSPEPHQFQPHSPGEDLPGLGASSNESSCTQSLTSQDMTRNDSPEHSTPVVRDSLGSHVLEDNSVPGSTDTRLTGDMQLQPLDNHEQDMSEDTDEEEVSDRDESDGYQIRSMKPADDFDTDQETLSSLPGSHPSGSKDELLKKHTAAEEKKDLVGNHNFGGPASRSNSMTSYARLSSVKQGSSVSDSSSEHSVSSTTKTRVTDEALLKQKKLQKHKAGIEGTMTTTEQTSV